MFFSFLKEIKPIILIAKKSLNLNRNILYIDVKIPRSYWRVGSSNTSNLDGNTWNLINGIYNILHANDLFSLSSASFLLKKLLENTKT